VKTSSTTNTSSALDYSSFGMGMVGRNWQAGSEYRFGYNGMENDDETYGNDNVLHFGARIYDNRLGRWMSVDKLAGKHAGISPYAFVNNNPVIYVDMDGNDYELYENHEDHTIIIKATYYYLQDDIESKQSINQAIIAIERQINGKYIYEVKQADGTIIEYDVKIELLSLPTDNLAWSGTYGPDYLPGTDKINFTKDYFGLNTFDIVPDEEVENDCGSEGTITYGCTTHGGNIQIGDKKPEFSTALHELGHSFGLHHMSFGIMQKLGDAAKSGIFRLPEFTLEGVQQILANANLGTPPAEIDGGVLSTEPQEPAAEFNIVVKGEAPVDFESGKVKIK